MERRDRYVTQMKAMAGRGTDKRLGEWLDNQDVCQIHVFGGRKVVIK